MFRVLVPMGRGGNPYLKLVTDSLGADVEVLPYRGFFRKADVFHYHWPEHLTQNISPVHNVWNSARRVALDAVVNRLRAGGGALVWTAHNLAPHEPLDQHRWGAAYLDRFYRRVDVAVAMSERQLPELHRRFPMIDAARWRVAPHPHYRSVYREWAPREEVRKTLSIPADALVIAMLGQVRPYKGVLEALKLFRRVARADEVLLIAGYCANPAFAAEIEAEALDAKNVRLRLGPLADHEYASLQKASDLALFNFARILNSGSLLAALSLDTPVLAPATETFRELAEANPSWVDLFDGPLTAERLRHGMDRARTEKPPAPPDLSRHEPEVVGRLHRDIYFGAAARTRD